MKTQQYTLHGFMAIVSICLLSILHAQAFGQFETQYFKPTADDMAANDLFGNSLAVSGHTIIVGVFSDDDLGTDSGSAYIYNTITGEQIAKLTASDGSSNDRFGWSVAISGSTAIVGAKWDDDAGTNSGAAYLFDINTGMQIAKLVALDADSRDEFGYAVAIGGLPGLDVAIVGSYRDNDHGGDSGSVYLFDTGTGQQLSKITPADGLAFDWFGHALSVNGPTLLVGADGVDLNGTNSGAAYLFDIFDPLNPIQLAKLLPNNGGSNDFFGSSVALTGTHAIVGAWGNDEFGSDAGAAYIFDANTGVQITKIHAADASSGDKFGKSIWASDTTLISGAAEDDDFGGGSGSAYLFDIASATQILKLLPNEGAGGDKFGSSVAISSTAAIVGATGIDFGSVEYNTFISNAGAAYVFTGDIDTDGDGLYDSWELTGIPYFDAAGDQQSYLLPGADPLHQDLYIEVDSMVGLGFSDGVVERVVNAFANAPRMNPDGTSGINLHIQRDVSDILPWLIEWQTDGCWPLDFDSWRSGHFGTNLEHGNPELLRAKAKAYRYCIVAERSAPDSIGGCSDGFHADNFVIYTGSRFADPTAAAVFMHELGHNLNLHHGGGDDINGKLNYPSIMNYANSYPYAWNSDFWQLDYTRDEVASLGILNEGSLNEMGGVGTPNGYYKNYWMPFGFNALRPDGTTFRDVQIIALDGRNVDIGDEAGTFFLDGISTNNVIQDLNFLPSPPPPINLPIFPSFPDEFLPFNDWANILLPPVASLGNSSAGSGIFIDEITDDAVDWINSTFPSPPGICLADLNGDGTLNFFDVSAFLAAYIASDPIADFTNDGTFNFFDVSAFLSVFSAGCP